MAGSHHTPLQLGFCVVPTHSDIVLETHVMVLAPLCDGVTRRQPCAVITRRQTGLKAAQSR